MDEFELPKISELLSKLRGKKWFTTIDLKDGFFHISVKEEDRDKTTFSTGLKLMRFKKMPQGYKNSPAIFQRAMNVVFRDLIEKCCVVYIDDILVYGEDEIEHDENLKKVLARLRSYGLVENESKRVIKKKK